MSRSPIKCELGRAADDKPLTCSVLGDHLFCFFGAGGCSEPVAGETLCRPAAPENGGGFRFLRAGGCSESVASETLCGPAAPATGGSGGPLGGAVAPAVAGTELDGKVMSGMVSQGASAIESGVEHLVSAEVTDESV